jgi:beta-glucosidase
MNGGALALQSAGQKAAAILEAWYPGELGGAAIAETLFGENNPSGRLPVTFYANTDQLPPFNDYAMRGRTYRYFEGVPLFPFGYGLSYSRFQYASGQLSTTTLQAGASLTLCANVKNIGERDGDETVEIYLIPKTVEGAPLRTLIGFEKVHLRRDETRAVEITITPRRLSLVGPDGSRSVQPGDYELYLGGGQPSHGNGVFLPFHIEGSRAVEP